MDKWALGWGLLPALLRRFLFVIPLPPSLPPLPSPPAISCFSCEQEAADLIAAQIDK